MAFEKFNKVDLDVLDCIYAIAKKSKWVNDFEGFTKQVEQLVGDLESPILWNYYLPLLEKMYGYSNNK